MAGRGARTRFAAAVAAIAILPAIATLGISAPGIAATASPGWPTAYSAPADYPTWQDVKNAQANEAATRAAVARIKAELARLQAEVERTQAAAEAAGLVFEERQNAYDEQVLVTQKLQEQATAAQVEADAALKTANRLLAELGRTGGGDLTANLLGQSGSADKLLYRLGAVKQLGERSKAVYEDALRLQKTAQALTDQAGVAQTELERLRVLAEEAFIVAQAAAQAAADTLAEQEAHKAELEAQLAVLVEKRQATEADYVKGIKAKWGSGASGEISAAGWARPVAGYISSGYGYRYHPIGGDWRFHNGTDLAGMGCGATIFAARQGTVTYAGPNGSLGNYVQIAHDDGTSTGYGHIMWGGIAVRYGQAVDPGQPIARVGSTGGSTGCHLHYIVRINGNLTDPVPFMRDRGIRLG